MSLKNILRKHLITEVNHHLDEDALGFIKKISEYLVGECGNYLNSCEIYLNHQDRMEYEKLADSGWAKKAKFIAEHLPNQTGQKYPFNLSGYEFDIYFSNAVYGMGYDGVWDTVDNAIMLSPVGVMKGVDACISILAHEITHIPQKQRYRAKIGKGKDFFQEINDITYWCNWREVDARISQAYAAAKTQIFTGERRDGDDVVETDYSETEKLVKQGGTPSYHGWNGMGNIRQNRYNNAVKDEYFQDDKQTIVNKLRQMLKDYMHYDICNDLATDLRRRYMWLQRNMKMIPDWRRRCRNPDIVKNFTAAAEFLSTFLTTPNDVLMDGEMAEKFNKYYVDEDCLDFQYQEIIQYLLNIVLEIGKRLKRMNYTADKMAYEIYTQMLRDKEYAAAHGEKPIRQTPNYDTWNKLSDYSQRKEKEDFSKLP